MATNTTALGRTAASRAGAHESGRYPGRCPEMMRVDIASAKLAVVFSEGS